MDRNRVKVIREELNKVLHAYGAEVNLSVETQGATFSDTDVTFKVVVAEIGDNGVVMSREANDFELFAKIEGLDAKVGDSFLSFSNERFEITGWNGRAKKMPVLAKSLSNGKGYKFPVNSVKNALKVEKLNSEVY